MGEWLEIALPGLGWKGTVVRRGYVSAGSGKKIKIANNSIRGPDTYLHVFGGTAQPTKHLSLLSQPVT